MTASPRHPARRTFFKQSAALGGAFILGLQSGTAALAAEAP